MLTLRALAEDELPGMYPWIKANFPDDERRPLAMMRRLLRRGLYEVLALEEAGTPVAYALSLLPKDSRAVLLDYLVVDPARRGQGLGGTVLTMLRDWYAARADAIFIESEAPATAPDPVMAARRIRFYERTGAVLLPFHVLLFGVDYAMLALPTGPSLKENDWAAILLDIYRQTLPPLFYATQVKLLSSRVNE